MTATITKEAAAWKLPDLDTVYHCEELGPMTLGQMLDGVDPDLVPSDQTMYEDLLWAFGAWDTLEEMNAAMATRVYVADPDGTVSFRLVKSHAGSHNGIRALRGRPAGRLLLSGARESVAAALGTVTDATAVSAADGAHKPRKRTTPMR